MNINRLNRRDCSLKRSTKDRALFRLVSEYWTVSNCREPNADYPIYDITPSNINKKRRELSNPSTAMDKLGLN